MKAIDQAQAPVIPGSAAVETIWLLGQPQLSSYLDFVRHRVRGGDAMSPRELADEWRAANDYYYDLERTEARLADTIDTQPLDPVVGDLAETLRAHRIFQSTFDTLPLEICMVEIDKLVTSQTFVTRNFSFGVDTLRPSADARALFRLCLPLEREQAPVTVRKIGSDRYQFSSTSSDFRPQRPVLLSPAQLADLEGFGPAAAGVALAAGYGSNFVSAIRSDDRILLQNGYHRTYALRAAGFSHVPCIVQTVTRTDELRLIASEEVCADPAFFFAAARPPLFKDFFDPRIAKRLPTRTLRTLVEVEYKMRMTTLIDED